MAGRITPVAARWTLLAAAATAATLSGAAGARQEGAPTDAKAQVPPVGYRSPFAGYRPHADAKATGWKEANDEVARIGGWRAYAREAYEASQAPAGKEKAPAAPPAMHHHGGTSPK